MQKASNETASKARTGKPVDFKQFDPRWGGKTYSSRGDKSQTMKVAGCAPTAAADVVCALADRSARPHTIAPLFVRMKFRVDGRGTKPACFAWIAKRYGLRCRRLYALNAVVGALSQGALVVAHMGKGYWTRSGHYIVLWKYDGKCLYACDPGSSTRKKQPAAQLKRESKAFYAIWPGASGRP